MKRIDAERQRFQIEPWPGTSYNAVAQTVDPHVYANNSLDMRGGFGSTRFYASASNITEPGAIRFLQGWLIAAVISGTATTSAATIQTA